MAGYRHAALLYAGDDEFVDATLPFITAGVEAGEPTLVVVEREKIDRLRAELNGTADGVRFGDMAEVGENPARIIPVWQEFVDAHPGQRVRGIGEPIGPERGAAELRECQHHERLLNPALDGSELFLLCPYDTTAMDPDVIEEARRSHPLIALDGGAAPSDLYAAEETAALFEEALPDPGSETETFTFDAESLAAIRVLIADRAEGAGMTRARRGDFILAINELASNSVLHGGGGGILRLWTDDGSLICEVADRGRIDDPLVDRRPPAEGVPGGRGLWLANQVCELVQLRSLATGVVARAHMRIR